MRLGLREGGGTLGVTCDRIKEREAITFGQRGYRGGDRLVRRKCCCAGGQAARSEVLQYMFLVGTLYQSRLNRLETAKGEALKKTLLRDRCADIMEELWWKNSSEDVFNLENNIDARTREHQSSIGATLWR
ncbi:hypothetical protein L596_001171 [Steinernema carpocapsae]|uniref:Uncharacterized protein n=1 Tax=Steinernema carpocapsae TaxID=34508 RepID=A0A4U8UPI3_STECR|nr:hypothetical protein L596_001171 [Steinernema carpocapsae]